MRVVGLTGGIGSGKSSVARFFADLGADIVDADQLAREAVEPGKPALLSIVQRFGGEVLDEQGALDRKKLGAIIFGDEEARRALNAIVHPEVARLAMERITTAQERGEKLVIYDVPLFFENKLERLIPEVIVVKVSPATQRTRIATRDGFKSEEIEQRIAAQMPLAEKVERATFVIDNDGTPEETRRQVERLYRALTERGE